MMVWTSENFPPCTLPDGGCQVVDEAEKERFVEATTKAATTAATTTATAAPPPGPGRVRKPVDGAGADGASCELADKCVQACAAYGRVCPCAARIASHAACEAMQKLMQDSKVFPPHEPNFVHLSAEDIVIGEKLGEGGFSNVNQCIITTGDEAGQEFAVKYLKRKAMVDLHQFKHGAADLAVEAFFLQQLDHPHIVKLHGVTAGSVETNVASGKECGFFIVVDKLYDTLEQRIEAWRTEKEQQSGGLTVLARRLSGDYREKRKRELLERIRMAYSIADAMEYLHSLNIIFRDLKPDNIGFDKDGVLKLFDFGLAKELKPQIALEDGRYQLTGNTGSRRYMAPEVAKVLPYEKSVDVYSFGILLWELCAAEKPFFGYSSNKHMQAVVNGGERPKMDSHHTADWPVNLKWIMSRCWSANPSERPSFTDVKEVLRDILHSKDSIPDHLLMQGCEIPSERDEDDLIGDGDGDEGSPVDAEKVAGIAALFRPRQHTPRSSTGGKSSKRTSFEGINPPPKPARSRTWSFSLR